MKKLSFIVAVCFIAVFSCKKENHNQPAVIQKNYTVRFNVSGLSQSSVPFQTNSIRAHTFSIDSLKSAVSVLYYVVYKDGVLLRQIKQNVTDTDFGNITDSFSTADNAGGTSPTYTIVMVAGQNGFTGINDGTDASPSLDDFEYMNNGQIQYFGDTFYKTISFEVPDSSYALSLDRIVSQLKVNIQDAIPANAEQISITFTDYQYLLASTGMANINGPSQRTTLTSVTPGTANTSISTILLNTEGTFSVEIKCTDASNNVIADKTVTGVSCKANETTVLTGDLFTAPGTGFNITYDPAWGTPTQITFN